MIAVEYRYLLEDIDRHGNVRLYFRRRGQRMVRIREPLGSPAFAALYADLVRQSDAGELDPAPSESSEPKPATWRWLCLRYLASAEFQRLEPRTQAVRRRQLELTWDESVFEGSAERFGDFPVQRMTHKAIKVLRDRKKDVPGTADNRVKAVRSVFVWGLDNESDVVTSNPTRDLGSILPASDGFHTWTVDEVEQYEARHPIGTKARLALALLLYTGVRRSDLVLLGKQHRRLAVNPDTGLKEPWLKFTQRKGRKRKIIEINVPILPVLQDVIDASPVGALAFLETEYGLPFTANGVGGWFRSRCDEAGLPHCSAHGLRKAGATFAAENNATPHQLMACYGWLTLQQAELYTRAARRKRLAGSGMGLIRKPGS